MPNVLDLSLHTCTYFGRIYTNIKPITHSPSVLTLIWQFTVPLADTCTVYQTVQVRQLLIFGCQSDKKTYTLYKYRSVCTVMVRTPGNQ